MEGNCPFPSPPPPPPRLCKRSRVIAPKTVYLDIIAAKIWPMHTYVSVKRTKDKCTTKHVFIVLFRTRDQAVLTESVCPSQSAPRLTLYRPLPPPESTIVERYSQSKGSASRQLVEAHITSAADMCICKDRSMIRLEPTVSQVGYMISLNPTTKILPGYMISWNPMTWIHDHHSLPGSMIPADPKTNCNKPFAF